MGGVKKGHDEPTFGKGEKQGIYRKTLGIEEITGYGNARATRVEQLAHDPNVRKPLQRKKNGLALNGKSDSPIRKTGTGELIGTMSDSTSTLNNKTRVGEKYPTDEIKRDTWNE